MRFSCGALRHLWIRSPRSLIDFLDSASFQTDSQIVAIDRLESRFLQILNTDIIDAVIQYSVSSKSSFRHVIRDRKSSPEIIIVSNENTVFLNPKHLAWKITGTTEMTMSITASTGTMENIGFSSGTATVAISDVPIVLNGSDSTSNPYGFSIAEAIVSKIVTANAARAFGSSLLSNRAASGNMIAQGQSAPCRLAIQTPRNGKPNRNLISRLLMYFSINS